MKVFISFILPSVYSQNQSVFIKKAHKRIVRTSSFPSSSFEITDDTEIKETQRLISNMFCILLISLNLNSLCMNSLVVLTGFAAVRVYSFEKGSNRCKSS